MTEYFINPVAKPRLTQRDSWAKRDCVMRYFAYRDECKILGVDVPEAGAKITFYMPMPKSWSKKKKRNMLGEPHRQKPDVDNLLKGLLDAVYGEDSVVWDIWVRKVWSDIAKIGVEEREVL